MSCRTCDSNGEHHEVWCPDAPVRVQDVIGLERTLGRIEGQLREHTDQDNRNFEELRKEIRRLHVSAAEAGRRTGAGAGGKWGAALAAGVAVAFEAVRRILGSLS